VVVAAIIAIGWTMRKTTSPAAPRAPVASSASRDATSAAAAPAHLEAKAKPAASQAPPSFGPAHVLPDSRTPLGEAVPTLREYAEAGDADAAVALSWRLSACTERALTRTRDSEQFLRGDIEREKADDRFTEEQRGERISNLQRQADDYVSERNACLALPADLRADWLGWIDRAAEAGSTAAMRGYARVATAEYYSASDVRDDLDTAIERRDKSRAYLEEALRRGDAEALRDLADAYSDSAHPKIYAFDPSKVYTYAYAGTLAGISRGNDLDRLMEEVAGSLDSRQLAEAEAAGRRIYETCCARH
jgi:hypothetical protein